MRKLAFLILLISLIFPYSVSGEGEYQAVLLQPTTTSFPRIDAYLDVHAPDGSFVHGLDASSVQILEDGKNRPVEELQELRLGVQISVVVNGAPSFTIRNNVGQSRFDTIRKLLEVWGASQKDIATDQLNLFTNNVVNQTNLNNSQAWLNAFSIYKPDLKQAQPTLEPLSNAIQKAMDTQFSPPQEKAIIYFTPLPGEEMTITVRDDLISRAKKAGVRCFIWMIAAKNQFADPAADHLRRLADETGGAFFAFSGSEPLPEIQTLIEPLRFLYQLHYSSEVVQSGNHKIAARVSIQETTTISLPVSFSIQLQPVNPIFVNVPPVVTRVKQKSDQSGAGKVLPASLNIEYLIEYPDGYPRDLVTAMLLVDGEVAQQNTTAPYNKFVWDLSKYDQNATHNLQIVVKDKFGFESKTAIVQVDVINSKGSNGSLSALFSSYWGILLLIAVFAAGILAAFLFMKFRPNRPLDQQRLTLNKNPLSPSQNIPDRQANPVSSLTNTISESRIHSSALLTFLDEDLQEMPAQSIELGERPQTWGNDRDQVDHWIDDTALEGVHTRIWRDPNGYYLIADLQTRLGTFVNHAPIEETSLTLMHGDLIQIGELRFRFLENPPRSAWQVEVQLYN